MPGVSDNYRHNSVFLPILVFTNTKNRMRPLLTALFFSISFYATGIPWITLSLGDLTVKILVALIMLIPFRLLLGTVKEFKA